MKRRIIYIYGNVLDARDRKRFGFDIINNAGYIAEAWDISEIFHGRKSEIQTSDYTEKDFKKLHSLSSCRSHLSYLNDDDRVILGISPDNARRYGIDSALSDIGLTFGYLVQGLYPVRRSIRKLVRRGIFSVKQDVSDVYKKFLLKSSMNGRANNDRSFSSSHLELFKSFKSKAPQIEQRPDFVIFGGAQGRMVAERISGSSTKKINVHTLDYDLFLQYVAEKESRDILPTKYAVFLDEDMPHHSDYRLLGIPAFCEPGLYYKEINKFFDWFVERYGIDIIVAAHPRANYRLRGNPYGKRKVVSNRTLSLVAGAELAFLHSSTSINFAILFQKPIVFLTSQNYTTMSRKRIDDFANHLSRKPIPISSRYPKSIDFSVDETQYRHYKHQYIKEDGSPEVEVWQHFLSIENSLGDRADMRGSG
jgi:hypothetical protein